MKSKVFAMEILLVRPENNEQLKTVKAVLKALSIDFTSREEYNPVFLKKIQESRKQSKKGKVSSLNLENLWK